MPAWLPAWLPSVLLILKVKWGGEGRERGLERKKEGGGGGGGENRFGYRYDGECR